MRIRTLLAAAGLLAITAAGRTASAEESSSGLKKYEYYPFTDTGRCYNYSCNYGFCCWIYPY
jgi:hypothetical protein